jgi:subtilisin-like proprotein convertase family protein
MQFHLRSVLLLVLVLLLLSPNKITANNPWTAINEAEINTIHSNRQIVPNQYLTYRLAIDDLQTILVQAPLRSSSGVHKKQIILHLPMPNGKMERFHIEEAPIMHPDLAARYPMLRSYSGVGVDDPTASVRFDVTQLGFHGMILSGRHGGVFIDPYAEQDTEHYISYYQKDFKKNTEYKCHFTDNAGSYPDLIMGAEKNLQGDCMLRTYRLALACTGEYADFHGGTIPSVMAAFHTTMTRVNGIFEKDVAIHLELIANTDDLIFLDAATDPYNFEYPTENQFVCDDIIGTENYDIGHAFGVGAGGAAERSSCCVEGLKAEGYSTLSSPVGDPFDINFVAHEFGHQFGCSHTANGNCNNTPSTSVEPGNAYSVMGQDFFCNPVIEEVRGAYFHAINIYEIAENVVNGPPGSCAMLTDIGNTPPSVEGGDVHHYMPVLTPFKLTAEGEDLDGDALTYCWEQMDNEKVTDPPVATNAGGPAFRSYEPVEEPFRYFPALEYLVNGTEYMWEVLPGVSRDMNFRVTVRDNFMGGGCTDEADVDLTFTAGAGPFLVQQPNDNGIWYQDASYSVAWDVANTDKAPVACSQVDILLSVDGGYTYPVVLASEVPNDGAHTVLAPQVTTSAARVMVACSDNIFFDISDENFSIEMAANPSLELAVHPPDQEVCGLSETADYTLTFSALAGFDEEITLTATGIPSGANWSFSQNTVTPPASVDIVLNDLENVASGDYVIQVKGTAASTSIEKEVFLRVNNVLPEIVHLMSPVNGATEESLRPVFTWEEEDNTIDYVFEIATNPGFGASLIEAGTTNENTYALSEELDPLTVYYWRVLPINTCTESAENIAFASFQTSGDACRRFTNDEPAFIPGFLASTTTILTIEEDFEMVDANISMEIFHKLVGDLKATLTAPSGVSIDLFDRPGHPEFGPGCTKDDLFVTFDDEANNTSDDFETTCLSGTDYAIEGTFQPITPLSVLDGQSSLGDWVLTVTDEKFSHSGAVDHWSLEFCLEQNAGANPDFSKMNVFVPDLGTEVIVTENLSAVSSTASAAQINYTLTSLPSEGSLLLNGASVSIGTSFTQENIDNNLLSYTNTNPDAPQDQFRFDIETFDGNWIHNEFLDINIGEITGGHQLTASVDFEVFPNPTNGNISLILHQAAASPLEIIIFDLMGNRLREVHFEKPGTFSRFQMDVQSFPAGIYLLQLSDGVSFCSKRFIKK